MLKDYFEVPNKPAIKSGNILSCDFTDHETFIPQPLDYSRGTLATYVDCNGLIKMSGELGPELVTNGDFATDSDWTKGTGTTISGGKANFTSATSVSLYQNIGTQSGIVKVTFSVTDYTSGILNVYSGGNQTVGTTNVQADAIGQYTVYVDRSGGNNNIIFGSSGSNNFTGSIDNVSVKEVDVNTPRIDYTTEIGKAKELQKPSLLLEPQSTNLIPFSEDITTYSAINATVTSNAIKSPDGTINSDKVNFSVTSGFSRVLVSSSGNQTYSLYVKYDTLQHIMIYANGLNGGRHIDIKNRIIGNSLGTAYTCTIENVGNDWSRITMFGTSAIGTSLEIYASTGTSYNPITIEGSVYIWGVQGEATAYATSYIPTSGSTVTRNQDIANNAGQLGVFNNEEGVLYCEIQALAADSTNKYIAISDGTVSNRVNIFFDANNVLRGFTIGISSISSSAIITDCNKVAFKYESGELALFLNGTKAGTRTASISLSGLDTFSFDNGGAGSKFYGRIKEVKAFRRALTDAELTELTNNIV